MTRRVALSAAVLLLAAVVALVLVLISGRGSASNSQIAMLEDDSHVLADPVGTLHTLRQLGVQTVRMSLRWPQLAPGSSSPLKPRFDAADPGAYPQAGWAPYDAAVRAAHGEGIRMEFVLTGPVPLWASGPGAAPGGPINEWDPSAGDYGDYVQAVGTRYSGSYRPPGSASPLPRVSFWEIWNEPNYGQDLAPQALDGSRVPASSRIYRNLLDAGWSALQRSGHHGDTILIGSLSPRGFRGPPSHAFPQGLPGYYSTTRPLQFVRALYCVNSAYQQLRGNPAAEVGCPTTAAASRQFPSQHPALFSAAGFGIHPYPFNLPPDQADSSNPDVVEFSEIPRLESALDRLQRIYGSDARPRIFNTEYGYITDPPNNTLHYGSHFVSPVRAAYYINWAEYISWRDPRIASYMQYLLFDPSGKSSGFSTGLITDTGQLKPAYYAYRMPIFLPRTSTTPGDRLEVWGCVRPAHFAQLDTHRSQRAQVQFRSGSGSQFRALTTVPITDPRGYVDLHLAFPSSGTVRLAWSYPSGQTIYSRPVTVAVG